VYVSVYVCVCVCECVCVCACVFVSAIEAYRVGNGSISQQFAIDQLDCTES
jgi:hypothetical protein